MVCIKLPLNFFKRLFLFNRLFRRLFRLDKMNVSYIKTDLYLIVYQGSVFTYNIKANFLEFKFFLKNCRNVLHNSIMINKKGYIFIGEYGSNSNYSRVPIHVSYDYGKSWNVKYIFDRKEIRHIHGLYYDEYDDCVWICTGDFNSESKIIKSDLYFKKTELIGTNSQSFRTCMLHFKKNYVFWCMDSQFEDSYSIVYNRNNKKIKKTFLFPGPVIYSKFFEDGNYIVSTSQEIGPSVKDNYVHLFVSKDFVNWKKISQFQHDGLNKILFKFGLICFASGKQNISNFPIFCEAVKNYDGKVLFCSLENQ